MRSVSRAIALLFLPALLLAQTTPHVGGYLQSRETYQESRRTDRLRQPRPRVRGRRTAAALFLSRPRRIRSERKRFQRPAIGSARYDAATTGGVNVDLPGGRTRVIADYVSRRVAFPGTVTTTVITQLQVKF